MSEENVELVRSLYAESGGDPSRFFELLDDDIEVVSKSHPLPDHPELIRGQGAVIDFYRHYWGTWDDYILEPAEITDAGANRVLVIHHERGRGRGSGVPFERRWVVIYTLAAGKLARIDAFSTREEALEAAGLSEWAMSQENVEIVRGLHEAFARGDNDTPFSVYDPEIEWDMTRLPLPGEESVYHGHDGVRRYWRAWLEAWEFIDAPIERFVEAGDNVVTLFGPMTGRGKKSGVEVEFPPWAQVWTLRDGKVVCMRAYPDHAEALEAAGLSE